MDKRGFMRMLGGGVAAALGFALAPKDTKMPFKAIVNGKFQGVDIATGPDRTAMLCFDRNGHLLRHISVIDRTNMEAVSMISEMCGRSYRGQGKTNLALGQIEWEFRNLKPTSMEKLLDYVDEPSDKFERAVARLLKPPKNVRIHSFTPIWHDSTRPARS